MGGNETAGMARGLEKPTIDCPVHGKTDSMDISIDDSHGRESTEVCPRCMYEMTLAGIKLYQEQQPGIPHRGTEEST